MRNLNQFFCRDRMCGAEDCSTCFPWQPEESGPELTPEQRWEALKASGKTGRALLDAIDVIEIDTPLSQEHSAWRQEMMDLYLRTPTERDLNQANQATANKPRERAN